MNEQESRFRALAAIVDELQRYASLWERSARLLGNATASDILYLCEGYRDVVRAKPPLTPEHLEVLQDMAHNNTYLAPEQRDAVRAALKALGEDPGDSRGPVYGT